MVEQPYPTQPTPGAIPEIPPDVAPVAKVEAVAVPQTDLAVWQSALGLILILLVGAYFRFTGVDWDSGQHLHPDERFMTNVATNIHLAGNIFRYFDTANSTLNPFPYGSFTYGMFPLFLTRLVGEIASLTDYDKIVLVGRVLSGLFDLAAVAMLFFLGARLYSRRVGLLAAGLYAAAVLPIQLSHYFTVDSFATVFIVAAFYIAVPVMDRGQRWHYAVFGLLTGLAMACKINTAPLAGIIVIAGIVRLVKGWGDPARRTDLLKEVLVGWLIAGAVAAFAFRVFQPYAFNGPGFFGISLNQRWLHVMREVTDQVAGKSEWPPNHHWTNRSQLTFAWIQTAVWGLGLPLGLTATVGWLWAVWRTWQEASIEPDTKREWQGHLLLVVWVGAYFVWQNAQFWRYMRYFMPIYPFAVLLAAWALTEFFNRTKARQMRTVGQRRQTTLLRLLAVFTVVAVTLSTYSFAFAFTRIYTRPHSRATASWWILENIPGPLNARIKTADGHVKTQPLAVPYDLALKLGEPWRSSFAPIETGTLSEMTSFQLYAPDTNFDIKLTRDPEGNDIIISNRAALPASLNNSPRSATVLLRRVTLSSGVQYYLHYTVRNGGSLVANGLALANDKETTFIFDTEIVAPNTEAVTGSIAFTPEKDTPFDRLNIESVRVTYPDTTSTVRLNLSKDSEGKDVLATSEITVNFAEAASPKTFSFTPAALESGQQYFVSLEVVSGAPVQPTGPVLAMETSWDDWLPLRVGSFDPLGGIYRTTNLELFEPDDAVKRDRMLDVLSHSDYLIISSNRSYDAMPRLPLRYPMTLKYYQALFGCEEQLIIRCAYPAKTGLKGRLGYELVAVFESNPNIGPFELSDQYAEEAFTVYDHPKVMIFKHTESYSSEATASLLNSVDLSEVLDQAPANYTAMPTALRLPLDRLTAQADGGTWSELFDPYDFLNWYQSPGVIAWYLLICIIGWLTWPIVFGVMRGLPDRGYPLAKLVGLLIVTWVAWFTASYKLLMFTRATLWVIVALLLFVSGFAAFRNRAALSNFTRARWGYMLLAEAITLALFLFFLWIRWLNPDLWHPWLGGEKPADYSFFQSAIRSIYFPPYDPWLSGHYVNYYYYGFVIAAVPTKMLGIVPAIAYNLALPTLFAFAGIGAYCVAYNLVAAQYLLGSRVQSIDTDGVLSGRTFLPVPKLAIVAGIASLIMMVLLGNLYQVRQLWQSLPEVAEPSAAFSDNIFENSGNVINGAWRVLTGQMSLPGDKGRWYFGPSRAILHDGPDTPITEFPLFSFLYADLHPHLVSMSIMLAALAWMLSLLFATQLDAPTQEPVATPASQHRWRPTLDFILFWLTGGLIVGALQPTHTWDYPGFVLLGIVSVISAIWLRNKRVSRPILLAMAGQTTLFVGLTMTMYSPFRQWFATDFSSVELWKFARTPLADYLTVHGLFLFINMTLLICESHLLIKAPSAQYILHTPLGELLSQSRTPLVATVISFVVVIIATVAMWLNDYQSVWFALPLLVWAVTVFFKPGQSLPYRVWLILLAAGLGLTILVELITLRGDIGRSNTVFKYYIEAWVFFSVAAGAAFAWLIPIIRREWPRRRRLTWLGSLALIIAASGTYTVTGIYTKVTDRWPGIDNPPHTLDGNAYMLGARADATDAQSVIYNDEGSKFILSDDYAAIRWLQDNVSGTPTIVEGTSPLYRWGSRIAINTGLPTVVGWDWHVKQHDSILPGTLIDNRIQDVREFYNTADLGIALSFLRRYGVQYIIVGALERKYYEADGLAKFNAMVETGQLDQAYPSQSDHPEQATFIYHVIDSRGE